MFIIKISQRNMGTSLQQDTHPPVRYKKAFGTMYTCILKAIPEAAQMVMRKF
jgi:hypothetical protein